MSGVSTPGSAPKAMSSRLLTMKFMQRAANSSPNHPLPSTTDEPSPKRRKTKLDSSPLRSKADTLADRNAVQAALASEEAKRQAALEKQAAEAGDTRWVLSFEDQQHPPVSTLTLRVVQAGFAHLDAPPSLHRSSDEELEEKPMMVGRRSFGKFNRILEKQQDPSLEESSESESSEEDDNSSSEDSQSDSDDPTHELIKSSRQQAADRIKAERKAKKRKARAELEEVAKKRRKNDINLNGLTSLSGRTEPPRKAQPAVACYNCGGPHYKRDCPGQKRGHEGGDNGPPRKYQKSS